MRRSLDKSAAVLARREALERERAAHVAAAAERARAAKRAQVAWTRLRRRVAARPTSLTKLAPQPHEASPPAA
jgi:hypothetical protein